MKSRVLAAATTLAGMELKQLAGIGRRKIRSEVYPRVAVPLNEIYEPAGSPSLDTGPVAANTALLGQEASATTRAYADRQTDLLTDGKVSFLDSPVDVGETAPYEVDPYVGEERGFPLLWSLKLWSLAPVRWLLQGSGEVDDAVTATLVRWLRSWEGTGITEIDRPGYLREYWTPYAVSRRIDNLARLAGFLDVNGDDRNLLATHLARNVQFLRDHVEYDIGGNHLVENGCALIVGGVALDDEAAVRQGVAILREELPAQLLADGLHFELSPMYHTVLLYRVASALDVLGRSGRTASSKLRTRVAEMYDWLARAAPDGANYPLLNDAAYREGPSRETCLRTAEAILGENCPAVEPTPLASQYYTLREGDLMVLVDGGWPCPPHLPAHGHNDVGNVVAWVEDLPIFVDTGVYNYAAGPRRQYARSVAAHNTVEVDGVPQAVTTGQYMMGPRVDPTARVSDTESGRRVTVEYAAPNLFSKYRHRRTVSTGAGHVRIEDRIASDRETATSRFHVQPEVSVDRIDAGTDGESAFRLRRPDAPTLRFTVRGVATTDVVETEYYPEYGKVVDQPTIESTVELALGSGDPSLTQTLSLADK